MKCHILFRFRDEAWGGANQFLKALREYFRKEGVYTETPEEADAIIFNSNSSSYYEVLRDIYWLKKQNPNLVVINRVDGPIALVRGEDKGIDKVINRFNKVCDGTVFQSAWCSRQCHNMGMKKNFETIIINAPDPTIFHTRGKILFSRHRRIRVIASSWSHNWNKGFGAYIWLDEHLDFDKYEMVFVGNSPVEFGNITHIPAQTSEKLAEELRKSDIFLTASESDPCSNSLIEALHCGLPAVALNDGGHPEIIGKGGETFSCIATIPYALDKLVEDYEHYQVNILVPTIEQIGRMYRSFIQKVWAQTRKPKNFYRLNLLLMQAGLR